MSIAVVPIFMSAGAAILPTIIVAITSVLAIILKPRELLRLIRTRPLVTAAVLAAVVLLFLIIWHFVAPSRAALNAESRAAAHTDWSAVALNILARQAAGKAPTPLATLAATDAPLVLGHDFSRCAFAGGPSLQALHPLWVFHPEKSIFLSTPLFAGNRIFVAACQADLGGYTGLLACLDAGTGKPLWQLTDDGEENLKPYFSSPALTADGKWLIIGQGLHQDTDCALSCYDAATGKLKWAVKTPLHIESSPAIFGDMAIVGAGAIEGPDGRPTGNPGYVFAVRISDGKELWRQPVNDPESDPAIDENGIVYIGSGYNGNAVVAMRSDSDEDLRAKNLKRILWQTPSDCPCTGPITIAGDLILSGSGNGDVVHSNPNPLGFVVALDRKTGTVRWRTKFEDSVLGAIAARDGIALCPDSAGAVKALSLSDGHMIWQRQISGASPVLAGCAFTGQFIYAVSSDGYLAILNPADGAVINKLYLNDQAHPGTGLSTSGPQISGGHLIVGSESGGLHCFSGSAE